VSVQVSVCVCVCVCVCVYMRVFALYYLCPGVMEEVGVVGKRKAAERG